MANLIEMIGRRFGDLVVVKYSHSNNSVFWKCICECGREVIRSSGDLNRPRSSKFTRNCGGASHDYAKTPLYRTYRNMRSRCENPNVPKFKIYGGRGIRICDEWASNFKSFSDWAINNGYKETLTIDRIDNDGNYGPDNCRWVDRFVQQNNTSKNRIISYGGISLTARQWDRKNNWLLGTVQNRLSKGFSPEEAVSQPLRKCVK
jgi:hypothetical protein